MRQSDSFNPGASLPPILREELLRHHFDQKMTQELYFVRREQDSGHPAQRKFRGLVSF